jgi:hypothetical protein
LQAQSATASLPAGEAASDGQAAGSGDTAARQPASEHTHWLWLVAPACGVVEPGGHGVQLVRPIVGA